MENKKATLYIEFRHNQARLDLIGNTHVALKECVKPYGIRNHTYQRDNLRETTRYTKAEECALGMQFPRALFEFKPLKMTVIAELKSEK